MQSAAIFLQCNSKKILNISNLSIESLIHPTFALSRYSQTSKRTLKFGQTNDFIPPSVHIHTNSNYSSQVPMEEESNAKFILPLLDKHILRLDGVKSRENNNGQTNSALFVHWFIDSYMLCSDLVFFFVEEKSKHYISASCLCLKWFRQVNKVIKGGKNMPVN